MSAAAGALLAAVADKLAEVLEEMEVLGRDMLCDLDPDDPPDGTPRGLVVSWRMAMQTLNRINATVGEAGATADAGAQALGELPTSSEWGSAPTCREQLCAVRQEVIGNV